MTKGQRVQKALKQTDVEVPDIANSIGVDESTVYRWKSSGKGRFSKNLLESLASILRVNYEWLQYGYGDIKNQSSEKGAALRQARKKVSGAEHLTDARIESGLHEDDPEKLLEHAEMLIRIARELMKSQN